MANQCVFPLSGSFMVPQSHTATHTMPYPHIPIETNQSESQLMFYLALDTLKRVKVARGTKKIDSARVRCDLGNGMEFIAQDPHYLYNSHKQGNSY